MTTTPAAPAWLEELAALDAAARAGEGNVAGLATRIHAFGKLVAIARAAHEFTTANRLADSALLGWLNSPGVDEPLTEVEARATVRDAALVALAEALAGGGE